jgi:hypothetical protein
MISQAGMRAVDGMQGPMPVMGGIDGMIVKS